MNACVTSDPIRDCGGVQILKYDLSNMNNYKNNKYALL